MNAREFFSGFSTARAPQSNTIDPGVLKASSGTLLVLRDNLVSAMNDSRRADFHGDYRLQLEQIDAELSSRVDRTETLADLDLYDHDDGRAPVSPPEKKRDAAFAVQLSRIAGALVCAVALAAMSGCASTNTVLRVGVGYDITDKINGCVRGIYGCGHAGTRETATLEILWAPSIRPGPYAGYSHKSHYSTGFPFNNKLDADFSDEIAAGYFVQFGERL